MTGRRRVHGVLQTLPASYRLLTDMVDGLEADGYQVPCRRRVNHELRNGVRRIDWSGEGKAEAAAVAACLTCPVVLLCDAYATEAGEHGVWGARTEKQRREGVYPPNMAALKRSLAASPG